LHCLLDLFKTFVISTKVKKAIQILLLIIAGEANFILPFVLARVFRPTVLEVYGLTNIELGTCFSIYGIVALFSYLAGGGLADKYSPRLLMAASLLFTALGGIYMASYPTYMGLCVLYGYWGFTTIFLFWAAMIKATRLWGGTDKQGVAFGLLDGGRGLVSYAFGGLGIAIFSYYLGSGIEQSTLIDRQLSYSNVIYTCTAIIVIIAILVFLIIKTKENETNLNSIPLRTIMRNYLQVAKIPSVGLLMIIILCAYTGYKITDIYSQFANEIMGYDQIAAAGIGRDLLGVRVFIGITIGLIADRTSAGVAMVLGFIVTLIGAVLFASGYVNITHIILFWVAIIMTATGVFALRALYFAAVQEGRIPIAVTGTAVGLISLVGYTPDVFMGPAIGYFLDGWPGEMGYRYIFAMLGLFSIIGGVASFVFVRINK
jgi:sugar phosphate permease